MKNLKEYFAKFKADNKGTYGAYYLEKGYQQGFIEATKLAAENATDGWEDWGFKGSVKQSILKALEE